MWRSEVLLSILYRANNSDDTTTPDKKTTPDDTTPDTALSLMSIDDPMSDEEGSDAEDDLAAAAADLAAQTEASNMLQENMITMQRNYNNFNKIITNTLDEEKIKKLKKEQENIMTKTVFVLKEILRNDILKEKDKRTLIDQQILIKDSAVKLLHIMRNDSKLSDRDKKILKEQLKKFTDDAVNVYTEVALPGAGDISQRSLIDRLVRTAVDESDEEEVPKNESKDPAELNRDIVSDAEKTVREGFEKKNDNYQYVTVSSNSTTIPFELNLRMHKPNKPEENTMTLQLSDHKIMVVGPGSYFRHLSGGDIIISINGITPKSVEHAEELMLNSPARELSMRVLHNQPEFGISVKGMVNEGDKKIIISDLFSTLLDYFPEEEDRRRYHKMSDEADVYFVVLSLDAIETVLKHMNIVPYQYNESDKYVINKKGVEVRVYAIKKGDSV